MSAVIFSVFVHKIVIKVIEEGSGNRMPAFTMIEARFCPAAQKNVAIEVTQRPGETAERQCLSRACKEGPSACRLLANLTPKREKT